MSFSDQDRLTEARARIDAALAMRVPPRPTPAMAAMDEQGADAVVSTLEDGAVLPLVGRLEHLQPPNRLLKYSPASEPVQRL